MLLETDRKNLHEFGILALRAARAYQSALLREGYNPKCARCGAIAYLARKTRWSWHFAAGAFDNYHEENDT